MKTTMLIIMDGFGLKNSKHGNAIKAANTPNLDKAFKENSYTELFASGVHVGLPPHFQGSSEVGHLNLGSGRVVEQEEVRIDHSIQDGSFFKNKAFLAAIKNAKRKKKNVHLMGLLQDQGVHAHQNHLFALMKLCQMENISPIIHVFTDGRDTPPASTIHYMKKLQFAMKQYGGRIGTIIGRYYAMDRDNRWERTKLAYEAIYKGKAKKSKTWDRAIDLAYKKGETDEFIKPRAITGYKGVEDGDSIIFYNYRRDRARQLTKAFVDKSFSRFERRQKKKLFFVAMTPYYKKMACKVAFSKTHQRNILAKVIENNKKSQLRAAETEKYAHVTYFFNDEIEKPFKKEERILVPSPKVATYDLQPEMSAIEVVDKVLDRTQKKDFDFIVINFANCDMVGHTGDFKATVKAVETVDSQIGRLIQANKEGTTLITADHGNAETLLDIHDKKVTSHSINKVPLAIVSKEKYELKKGKALGNVAPTILEIMGLKAPKEMLESLILKK